MSTITEFATLFTTVNFAKYTAQTTGSQGTTDLQVSLSSLVKLPLSSSADMNVTTGITTGFHTYYKVEGFNPITQQYENWHSMDAPLLVPPSGNTLQNIGIVGSWIDR